MKITMQVAAGLWVAAALVGGGPGLTATAQTITPGTGSASCSVGPTATGLTYTFSGSTLNHWEVVGDLVITSSTTANPVTISSTGFGKGVVKAVYGAGCNAVPYDVFKSFNANSYTSGATDMRIKSAATQAPISCIPSGATTFYVNPVITSAAQIGSGAGVDTYAWSTVPANAATITNSLAGEGNVVAVTPASGVSSFRLYAQIGQCNSAQSSQSYLDLAVVPSITLTSSLDPTDCQAANSTASFTVSVANPVANVTYTWKKPPSWTLSLNAAGTVATIIPDGNVGDVVVSTGGTASCNVTATATFTLKRSLVSTYNAFSVAPALTPPGNCLTPNSPYTLTITNAPSNATFQWTIPAGFTSSPAADINGKVTTTANSLTVTPTGSTTSGAVSVVAGIGLGTNDSPFSGCSGSIGQTFSVSGQPSTCTYTLYDQGCGAIQVRGTVGGGCLPSGTTYTWSASSHSPVTTNANTYSFPGGLNNETVSVTISNATTCLLAIKSGGPYTSLPSDCGGRPAGAAAGSGELSVFPNPGRDVLTVQLPLTLPGDPRAALTGEASLTLTDALGRVVWKGSTRQGSSQADVKALANGVYLLRAALASGKTLTQQVTIAH